ncbi:patatin-like phospholipase family protein [Saccharomonospora azurea]|uniref:Patatin-like phospholipase n=1 Tax=Saccharomonospora azurea NA-128 TaxID=882081 RepID=H8GED2_9PSEU|nr:patatin-like phospholipase family protein [Saccharomonospora azurea]EHY87927.1 Patatin-like phospholipase [Saccharomonospora azurea NA-128]
MSVPGPVRRDVPSRPVAAGLALAAVVLTVAGGWWHTGSPLIAVEFPTPSRPADAGAVTSAAAWGYALVACYGLGLYLGTAAAGWVWRTPPARAAVRFGLTATGVAVVSHLIENTLLLVAGGELPGDSALAHSVTALAVAKYSAVVPAALIAVTGAAVLVWRCVAHSATTTQHRAELVLDTVPPRPIAPDDPPLPVDPDVRATRWRQAYTVPDARPDLVSQRWHDGEHTTGFCLSGGGIRAASVALGALRTLREELLSARYLVSVSGGGFTAGALQLALTGAGSPPPGGTVERDPETVFTAGTAEFNHIRRHSSYLADSPGEVLAALGRIARGLVLSLAVLFGPALVLGVAAGWLYQRVPLTSLSSDPIAYPTPRFGAAVAVVVLALCAFLFGMLAQRDPHGRGPATRLATDFAILAWIVAGVAVVVPALAWASAWLLSHTDRAVDVGASVGALVLTYLSAVSAMAWRNRARLRRRFGFLRRSADKPTAVVPDGLTQRLLVIVTTGVLALLWLLLLGAAVMTEGRADALWTAAATLVVVVVLGGVFDVTSLSLHPFYRERVARAFAVRVLRRHSDGQKVAVPYDPAEGTTLSAYGVAADGVPFPEVVFAAAANLKGEHRTPPGLGAVSFTMSAKWTGGPDVGWVRTDDLERISGERIRRDLTVQGAVALSGAAFASAMGRLSRWFQVLLAVSGARLGAWLPNPGFVRQAREAARRGDWAYPWLPKVRRLPYLVREVFGSHPHHDRLLHVSDGAHYDNLGLVELFRRRCTRIYCIDASNDQPPSARTLAEALELAREELGVRVELHEPWRADAGSARPELSGHPLADRMAVSPVITGTVHYPPESGLDEGVTGELIVVRGVLWPEVPYALQAYALHHPQFPNDSTGDQWFDHGEFASYTELGARMGEAVRARTTARSPVGNPPTPPAATARRSPAERN